jgi:hypothetical protein
MPRTRIKPNTTFVGSKLTIPASTQQQLSSEQRGRLKRIAGLPPAVLPEVETIAAYFLALARRPPPSDARCAHGCIGCERELKIYGKS